MESEDISGKKKRFRYLSRNLKQSLLKTRATRKARNKREEQVMEN
jgi:hypothetical protein